MGDVLEERWRPPSPGARRRPGPILQGPVCASRYGWHKNLGEGDSPCTLGKLVTAFLPQLAPVRHCLGLGLGNPVTV